MRGTMVLPVVLLLSTTARAEEAPDARRLLRVAVADFVATDVPDAVALVVSEAVVAELRKRERLSVVGMKEIRDMLDLEAERQMLGCSSEESCLAEIADSLGVDVLVTGTVATVGTDSVLGIRRIDQKQAAVAGTVSERLPRAGGDEFLAAIGPATEQLFTDHPLKPGQTAGVSDKLRRKLFPPPVSVPAFATLAAASAVAATVAATTAGWWTYAYVSHIDLGKTSVVEPQSGQAFRALEGQITTSAIAFYASTGAALLLGGGTLAASFFTDWEGDAL